MNMFSIKADLKFDSQERTKPISGTSYRPLLYFDQGKIVRSGLIVMEDNEVLEMHQVYNNRIINIYFYEDLEQYFKIGQHFWMAEGSSTIGQGIIVEILGILSVGT